MQLTRGWKRITDSFEFHQVLPLNVQHVWWSCILTTFIICSIIYLQFYLFYFSLFFWSNAYL